MTAAELIAKLKETLKAAKATGLVRWASINKEGVVHVNGNTACHAGMSYPGKIGQQEYIASVDMSVCNPDYMKGRVLPLDIKVEYLRWLTYKSAYAKFFVKKGGKAVHNAGMVVCKPSVGGSNILAGALIAHRYIWEYPTVIMVWHYLVKHGVDPSIAFYHAHQVKTSDFENIDNIQYNLQGHNCLSGASFNKASVLRFKEGKPFKENRPWSKDDYYTYTPIAGAWGDGGVSYLSDRLPRIREEAKAMVKRTVKVNPFPKAGERVDLREVVPINEFTQLWAELLKKEYEIA